LFANDPASAGLVREQARSYVSVLALCTSRQRRLVRATGMEPGVGFTRREFIRLRLRWKRLRRFPPYTGGAARSRKAGATRHRFQPPYGLNVGASLLANGGVQVHAFVRVERFASKLAPTVVRFRHPVRFDDAGPPGGAFR